MSNNQKQSCDPASNGEVKPLWIPTVAVERMMRECKESKFDTVGVDRKTLEGLLYDSLLWRQERAARQIEPVETTPERPVRFDLSRSDYDDWSMCPDGTGDYVRWEDVKRFFESPAVEPPRDLSPSHTAYREQVNAVALECAQATRRSVDAIKARWSERPCGCKLGESCKQCF